MWYLFDTFLPLVVRTLGDDWVYQNMAEDHTCKGVGECHLSQPRVAWVDRMPVFPSVAPVQVGCFGCALPRDMACLAQCEEISTTTGSEDDCLITLRCGGVGWLDPRGW